MTEPEIPTEWVEPAAEAIGARHVAWEPEGWVDDARAALSAVLPLMERALKAEAWNEGYEAAYYANPKCGAPEYVKHPPNHEGCLKAGELP